MVKEIILYGLKNYMKAIDNIIQELDLWKHEFDIRLILTEALTNAFKHGNNSDCLKPIYLRYSCINRILKIVVQDSGDEEKFICIPDNISEEDILDAKGRGLFLINSVADSVEFKGNSLIICKRI